MKKVFSIVVLAGSLVLNTFAGEKNESNSVSSSMATVSGVVVDKVTGEKLAGVEVTIDELGLTTYSDFDGNFSFQAVTPGTYSFSADIISYENCKSEVKLPAAEKKDVKLELASLSE